MVTLAAVIGAALFSITALTRRQRSGWAAAVGLGLLCTHIAAVRASQFATQVMMPYAGPATVVAWLLAGSALLAPVAASVCCITLQRWRAG